jgi:hypothetical protein
MKAVKHMARQKISIYSNWEWTWKQTEEPSKTCIHITQELFLIQPNGIQVRYYRKLFLGHFAGIKSACEYRQIFTPNHVRTVTHIWINLRIRCIGSSATHTTDTV